VFDVGVVDGWSAQLRALPVEDRSRGSLFAALKATARLRSAVDAFEARCAAAVDALGDRGVPASTMLRSAGKIPQREADRRSRRADTLSQLPEAAEKLASGELSAEHVDVLGRAADATSPDAVAESGLIDTATRRPADLMAKDARDWIRREQTDAEVAAVQAKRMAARRACMWDNDDGMTVLHAEFDPVKGAQLRNHLDAATDALFHADGGRGQAGEHRTPEQRRSDALAELITGSTASGKRHVRHHVPIVIHHHPNTPSGCCGTDHHPLGPGTPTAQLVNGTPIPAATADRLMCGADVHPILFNDTTNAPTELGRTIRLATDAQWVALIARDGGCVACGAAPTQCAAHHIQPWHRGGRTDLDNLVLLCGHHHTLIHEGHHTLRKTNQGTHQWELLPP